MNECTCDNCNKDCSSDYIYCQKCYDSLTDEINSLEEQIDTLSRIISQLEN